MTVAPIPANEKERLDALYDYRILDTPSEAAFDELAKLACYICATPIAYISLIDAERQWFKAKIGPLSNETSRDVAFCAHCILQSDISIVPDTLADERFVNNPLVTAEPGIRFYAGAPLITSYGLALGSVCVMDYTPRELSPNQGESLKILSSQVMRLLEIRNNIATLEQAVKTSMRSLTTIWSES